MSKRLIQPGNSKLGANMYMFNLPANKEVCGRECKGCYAIKEQVRFPTSVVPARIKRYEASLQLDFSSTITKELSRVRNKPKYFRIHASGEFYDQAYVNKWASIVKKSPDIIFYAYTKRKKDFDFSKLTSLDNFILIDSFHFGRLNYGKKEKAPVNAFICPDLGDDASQCGTTCTWCMEKPKAEKQGVYFVQH